MKMSEIADFLLKKGVRPDIFAIDTVAANETVVLYRESPTRWVVFYAERGLRTCEKVYEAEDDACRALIARALAMEDFARSHESNSNRHGITSSPRALTRCQAGEATRRYS